LTIVFSSFGLFAQKAFKIIWLSTL